MTAVLKGVISVRKLKWIEGEDRGEEAVCMSRMCQMHENGATRQKGSEGRKVDE